MLCIDVYNIDVAQTPYWKSLCKPASLPLTTDFFPTPRDLKDNYKEYQYTLDNEGNDISEAMLLEITCQRYAQDYQIITSRDTPSRELGPDKVALFFSARNQFHRVMFDKRARTIEVKR